MKFNDIDPLLLKLLSNTIHAAALQVRTNIQINEIKHAVSPSTWATEEYKNMLIKSAADKVANMDNASLVDIEKIINVMLSNKNLSKIIESINSTI